MSAAPVHMRLEVFTPTGQLVESDAVKVLAEGSEGLFALLPRHIDLAAALPPGLFTYVTPDGHEHFLGIDEGVLVKCGDAVRVSTLDAFESDDLAALRERVADRFLSLDEEERQARGALARLEAGVMRHVLEIER
ncbi:MAG: F0F1 ATP synthase subunit epsilon [Paracoccaceae bacterium]